MSKHESIFGRLIGEIISSQRRRRGSLAAMVEMSSLERRICFDAVFPTAAEQYLLQLINRARANPTAELQRIVANGEWPTGVTPDVNEGLNPGTISTAPAQPLAMNPNLLDSARKYTSYVFANPNTPAHLEIVNGVTLGPSDRMIASGYNLSGPGASSGENLWTVFGNKLGDTVIDDMTRMEQDTFVDYPGPTGTPGRGHRAQLLNPGSNEVGLGLGSVTLNNPDNTTVNEYITTQDYANAGNGSFLCGVAFNDLNNDQFYEPGEELAGVTITATSTADSTKVFSTTTWSAGGYSLALPAGSYIVTASGGNIGTPAAQNVTIGTQNVEADFIAATTTPAAPVIVTQPQNTTPFSNAPNFSFSVAATGYPLPTVQWQSAPFGSNTFTPIAGATNYTYTAPQAKNLNGNQYQAVLTNSQGTVTSSVATLTVINGQALPITITTYPMDQTVNAGDTVTFSVVATGYTSLQWSIGTPAGNFTDIPGATSPTLTFTADPSQSGNTYNVQLNNSSGGTGVSGRLTVNAAPAAPTVTAPPQPQTAPADGTATLSVGATGDPDPDVVWYTPGIVTTTVDPGTATPNAIKANHKARLTSVGTGRTVTVTAPPAGKSQQYEAQITNGNGSVTTQLVTVSGNNHRAVFNDSVSLQTAAKAALAAIQDCKKATLAAEANLTADLVRLKASSKATRKLKLLATNEQAARDTFTQNETTLLNSLSTLAAKVYTDSILLKQNRSSPTLGAQLQTDVAALQAAAAASTAPADATNCKFATLDQLAPIAAVAPKDVQLQKDVLSAQTNAYTIGQAEQAPVVIVQEVVNRIAVDA